jgi:hypothetical protein
MPKLNFSSWMTTYRPIQNPIDTNAACDGKMIETYGPELDFVVETHLARPNTVWTIVETDTGKLRVANGFHRVNRFGYFICEVPYSGPTIDFKYA